MSSFISELLPSSSHSRNHLDLLCKTNTFSFPFSSSLSYIPGRSGASAASWQDPGFSLLQIGPYSMCTALRGHASIVLVSSDQSAPLCHNLVTITRKLWHVSLSFDVLYCIVLCIVYCVCPVIGPWGSLVAYLCSVSGAMDFCHKLLRLAWRS